jgi:AraC-like DNA-binding protein
MLIADRASGTGPGRWAWPAGLAVWGPGHAAAAHAHHAVQLVLPFEGQLRARGSRRPRWTRAGAIIVAPDASHEIDPPSTTVLVAFIDPESAMATAMLANAPEPLTLVPPATVRRWRRTLGAPHAVTESRVRGWMLGEFGTGARFASVDERVTAVVRILRARRGDLGNTSLAHLASAARLSPSRFAHVFTASIGLPVRRYLLWLRLQRATAALASGDTVTEAAYVAGFADAAHLSRTFRRMFGCPPRELIQHQKQVREVRVGEDPHV